jgi:hypothetical protein
MADLQGKVGEVRMTIQVTRKETGKVEQFDLVGYLNEEQLKEIQNDDDSQHGSPQRGD